MFELQCSLLSSLNLFSSVQESKGQTLYKNFITCIYDDCHTLLLSIYSSLCQLTAWRHLHMTRNYSVPCRQQLTKQSVKKWPFVSRQSWYWGDLDIEMILILRWSWYWDDLDIEMILILRWSWYWGDLDIKVCLDVKVILI